ncbi:LysR family transcriptional regulator [Sphingomonas sp. G-3-2-10]|uniref:LysR substrate-binding domain-containing protein n=1 Tax=Sphingomonas sp. G-3-2-10 TaxID=2728838 RepID=UPI00146D83A4|nr:LysR family transcriptional regulator [Sphingomonas sp. G-3-2-10]
MSAWRGVEEFLAVVAAGSFTGAAENLGVSKSFVSKTVNELEARLGTQLLTRTTRRLSLTAAGELFFDQCSALQENLIELEQQMAQFQSAPVGRLRIGLSDIFGSDWMSALVADFSALHPEIIIEPIAYLRESDVMQERFDVVIRYGRLQDSAVKARLFGYLSYCLCASPEYVAEHGWPESPEQLSRHKCLTDASGVFEFNGGATARLKGRWRSNSGVALRWAARRGLGIAHLPVSVIRSDLAEGHILACEAEWSFHDKEVWVVFSPGIMPAATRFFIDFLAQRFTKQKVRPWDWPLMSPTNYPPTIVHEQA